MKTDKRRPAATREPKRLLFSTTISSLAGPLRLRHPLTIVIELHREEVLASWPEVEAWGSGATESDAINSLKDEIAALYEDLAKTEDNALGKLPLLWKRSLLAAVEREE